jgi:hypothetical protein
MPSSTNDVCCLRCSTLYHLAITSNIFDTTYPQKGISPYLIGDKAYALHPWLITLYRELPMGERSIMEWLFNRKLST